MSKTPQPTITPDHIKLLRRSYVGWNDCEYGAPEIDCKRPYGNSDVAGDIAEILGWKPEGDDGENECLSSRQRTAARKIHEEMKGVLQIVLETWVAP